MLSLPRVHWSAIMVRQSDGPPLIFYLNERNRLLNKGARQRPRTEFFREYRSQLEGSVRPRTENDFRLARLEIPPERVSAAFDRVEGPADDTADELLVDSTNSLGNFEVDFQGLSQEFSDSFTMPVDWCFPYEG
jgi:hypothetical protein